MSLDYKFYKENDMLDFPQDHLDTIVKMKLVGKIMNNKKIKEKAGDMITKGMLDPYKKAIEEDD